MDVQDDEKSAEMTEEVDKALESEAADPQDSSEGTVDAGTSDSVDGEPNSDAGVSDSDVTLTEEQMTTSEEPVVEEAEAAELEEPESAQPAKESQPDDEESQPSTSSEEEKDEKESETVVSEEPESAQSKKESQPDDEEGLTSTSSEEEKDEKESEMDASEEPESAQPEEESQTDDEGDRKEASDGEAATESADQVDQAPSPQQDPADNNEYVGTAEVDISIPIKEASPEEEEKPTLVSPEKDDGREWYVVHCYSGYENKVRHNIEQRIETMGMKDLIFDVVVPTEEEIEVKDGKRRTVERRVFPGYILINMILGEESWYVVRNTPGVTSFVGMGEEPTPLRPEEVSQIIKRMESDAPRIKVTFKQGERVRIVDGPFNDFRGNVEEIDMERAKVRVMVNFFGRETPVELDFLQVEKA